MTVRTLVSLIGRWEIKRKAALVGLYLLLDSYGWLPLRGIDQGYSREEVWALRDRPELRELLVHAVIDRDDSNLMERIMALPGTAENMPLGQEPWRSVPDKTWFAIYVDSINYKHLEEVLRRRSLDTDLSASVPDPVSGNPVRGSGSIVQGDW